MRITNILALVLLGVVSCHKSDNGGEEIKPAPIDGKTSNAYFKDGFTGSKGEELIPLRNINNIRTNDLVPYTITITDTKIEGEVSYVFTPTTDETKSHQSKGVDYDLFLKENDEIKKVETTDFVYKQTGTFEVFIKPLVAGTFQIPFVFEKKVDGKVVETMHTKIVFNAVTITAVSKAWRAGWVWKKLQQWSDNRRSYKFKIDDGSNATDIYLEPQKATQTFSISYKEHHATGNFVVGAEYEFHPTEERITANPELNPDTVTITIIQQRAGERDNVITYYNVPITNKQ